MVYSIQRDEGAQALESHLNVIDSKKEFANRIFSKAVEKL